MEIIQYYAYVFVVEKAFVDCHMDKLK